MAKNLLLIEPFSDQFTKTALDDLRFVLEKYEINNL